VLNKTNKSEVREMNIQEAVKKSMEKSKYITLPEFKGGAKIKPTNGCGNCIVMNADGSNPSKSGWQPSADELMRDDWLIVD
jgi:hypothetical protein